MNERLYQSVIIVLDNGEKIIYSGRYQVDVTQALPNVKDISFTLPRTLPEKCTFETMVPRVHYDDVKAGFK